MLVLLGSFGFPWQLSHCLQSIDSKMNFQNRKSFQNCFSASRHMKVSKNRVFLPQIIHFILGFSIIFTIHFGGSNPPIFGSTPTSHHMAHPPPTGLKTQGSLGPDLGNVGATAAATFAMLQSSIAATCGCGRRPMFFDGCQGVGNFYGEKLGENICKAYHIISYHSHIISISYHI